MIVDALLCCGAKDASKLPWVLEGVKRIAGLGKIVLATPRRIADNIGNFVKNPQELELHADEDWEFYGLSGGMNFWIFQQHLKLLQPWTGDKYVTVDCDTVILRPNPFPFYVGSRPIFWVGREETFPYKPYFEYNRRMLGVDRVVDHTFIGEMNNFDRKVINEMVKHCGCADGGSFIAKSMASHVVGSCIGEPELYGNFFAMTRPGQYEVRRLKQFPVVGKHQKDLDTQSYTTAELEWWVAKAKAGSFHTISIHSWINPNL